MQEEQVANMAHTKPWTVSDEFWEKVEPLMSKDYERSCASGEAFVYAAMIRLMTRRLARA